VAVVRIGRQPRGTVEMPARTGGVEEGARAMMASKSS
jgi:hypothetical protein